jgi:predicted nicotinamide N-methyase
MNGPDRRDFILANTKLLPVPLVPEIRLHLAHEAVPLWQKTEEELGEMGLPPPFWAFAWAGGQALARYVLDHADAVASKRVLDLASGSGLVGIAAMKAGAASVLAADIDLFAVEAINLNANANGVMIETTADDLLASPFLLATCSMKRAWPNVCWLGWRWRERKAVPCLSATPAAATCRVKAWPSAPAIRCP